MNLPIFNPMNDLDKDEEKMVRLVSFGQEQEGQYGSYWPDAVCEVEGIRQNWKITSAQKRRIDEGGFVEGNTFNVSKWFNKGKKGINVNSPDARNPYSQPPLPATEHVTEKPVQDKISRGVSWNKAWDWCMKHKPTNDLSLHLINVAEIGEQIVPYQSDFVKK